MIVIRRLETEALQEVINLSIEIFHPTPGELERYHNPEEWKTLLDQGAVMLGAYQANKLGGFIFARRVSQSHFHLWQAGVLLSLRGQGMLKQLMGLMEEIVRAEGVTVLTANTYEQKFPIMFQLLPRYGFHLDHTVDQKIDGRTLTKSYFKKELR